jgi:hypothetical protein
MDSIFIIQGEFVVPETNLTRVYEILKTITNTTVTSNFNSNKTVLLIRLQTQTVELLASALKETGPIMEELSQYIETSGVTCVGDIPDPLKKSFETYNTKYVDLKQFNEAFTW